jgi:AcrR family transcriptional regulator
VLLTMSTPAPALVITTPTEAGGAPSMLSEAARDRGVVSVARRREGALYPKLRPGPHSVAPESVASNQRARLYGATIELVASRGYDASTAAELCGLAGVSKRTLYERFPGGKRECFLATYDIIVRRAEMHVLAAGRRGLDRPTNAGPLVGRLRAVVEAFAHEVATYPNAARLVLATAFDAGPAALARMGCTAREAERVIFWSLREEDDASALSPLMVKGLVGDGARLGRARRLDGRAPEPALLTGELADLCPASPSPRRHQVTGAPTAPICGASQSLRGEIETVPCIRMTPRLALT